LVWGEHYQAPRLDPWAPATFWQWWLTPQPDSLYKSMPVIPTGAAGGFVPSELCLGAGPCPAGLTIDGQRSIRLLGAESGQPVVFLHKLVRLSEAHRLIGISLAGLLYERMSDSAWRLIPPPDYTSSGGTEAATGQPVATLAGHDEPVGAVDFSPDGKLVLTGSGDNTARLWDAATGQPVGMPLRHDGPVGAVDFSPDGKLVLTGSGDKTARLWDAATGKPVGMPLRHDAPVGAVAFSPDGSRVLTGSGDNTARLWDAATGKPAGMPLRHDAPVGAVAFSPDGKLVLTGSVDKTARLWNPATGGPVGKPMLHDAPVQAVAFSPDGKLVLTGSWDKTARLWDAMTGEPVGMPLRQDGPVGAVAFSPDGTRIVSGGDRDGKVRLWSTIPLAFRAADIARMANGECLIIGSEGRVMSVHDDFQKWQSVSSGVTAELAGVAVGSNDHFVAVGAHGTVLLLPAAGGLVLRPKSLPSNLGTRNLNAVAFEKGQGWIGGGQGLIMTSSDAGESWRAQSVESDAEIRALHIQSNGVGWAAGQRPDGGWVALRAASAVEGPWNVIMQYASPAWYITAALLLPFAGFLNVLAWRPAPVAPVQSISSQGAPERPIGWNDPDPLRFKPLAWGLSRFIRNVNTEPPLTVAITGRWGSGKSSLMNLLAEDLSWRGGRPVRFNAWHHREEAHLLAALFENIRAQAIPSGFTWPGLVFRVRLFARRSDRLVRWAAAGLLFVAIASAIVWFGANSGDFAPLQRFADAASQEVLAGLGKDRPNLATMLVRWVAGLGGVGALALLVLWIRARVTSLPGAGKMLASVSRNARLADFQDQLSLRYRFGIALGEVCSLLRSGGSPGLLILIDDLDRCPPDDVTKILEAISFCVGAGPCIVVMGMDRRQVEFAVGEGFEKLVKGLPDEELELDPGTAPDDTLRQQVFARRYLEKLVNIEVAVPRLDEEGLRRLLRPDRLVPAVDEGPEWLPKVSAGARAVLQISRVMFLAIIVGLALLAGLDHLPRASTSSTPGVIENPPRQLSPEATSAATVSVTSPLATRSPRVEPATIDLPIRELAPEADQGRARWLWWGPMVLVVAFSALWVIGMATRRRDSIVQDSPHFARALDAVEPLLTIRLMTPRLVKRFQNRMRYLAERMRTHQPDTDWVAGLLHRVGRLFHRSLVPTAWFAGDENTLIPEDALILLGAIEQFSPKAFSASASHFFANLEDSLNADQVAQEAWKKTMSAYRAAELNWPAEDHIRVYRDIVLPAW
jgi:WD40 repeat protein